MEFNKIVSEYAPILYRIALAKTGDTELATDVCQQTFVVLLEKEPHFSHTAQLKVWLIRTVIKLCASEGRKFDNSKTLPIEDGIICAKEDTLTFEFLDLLSTLPETLREVTVLFYIEDMSVRDIANALSLSTANVKTRLSRARKILEKIYKEEIL